LTLHRGYENVLEIGPGTAALTKHLLEREDIDLMTIEVDREAIAYLREFHPELRDKMIEADFLKIDLETHSKEPMGIIGNFPYNISSQILFKVLDHKDLVMEVVGMFQREVARRVASPPGSREYGIISVLLQAYYDIEYLFTVDENEFDPPPKVKSGVIRLKRNKVETLPCDEVKFKQVVKMAFNQRRKNLRNSLRALTADNARFQESDYITLRPEQLGVKDFIEITKMISFEESLGN
jgi:16S rRNA (adenine1518-N6/adenine1519-N6)-dimethyltransferase